MSLEVWVPGCCHRGSWHRPITPALLQVAGVCHVQGCFLNDQLIPFCATIMHGVPKEERASSQDEPGRNTQEQPCKPSLSSPVLCAPSEAVQCSEKKRNQKGGKGQPGNKGQVQRQERTGEPGGMWPTQSH